MRRLPSVFLFVAIAALSRGASAVPAITGSSGTYSDGSSVTITGSGFGSGPNVVIFDDFEGGTTGSAIRTGAGSATVGQWGSIAGCVTYSTATAVSGTKALRADQSCTWNNYAEVSLPNDTTEFFYIWNKYIAAGTNWPGEGTTDGVNWKNIWTMRNGTTDNDLVTSALQDSGASWVLFGNNVRNYGTGQSRWLSNDTVAQHIKGQWHRNWVWVKGDPGASTTNGSYRYWVLRSDGAQQVQALDNANYLQSGGSWSRARFNGYGRQTNNSYPMFDDIYVATGPNARARVEIGNASTYAASTKLTVATPTAWSASSITATFRRGNLATGTHYLYVFDSAGTVNATGYPITVSGGAAPTQYTATCSAGSNGTCTPASQTVDAGQSTSFTVTPNSGYTGTVAGTCGGSPSTAAGEFVYTTDAINANCSVTVTFAGDTTPPVISSPLPSGEQPYGTASVTLQVTTNEAATCKYHTTDVAYASMGSTFGTTGGTDHQQTGFSTTNGSSYTRYVRCIDAAGNASAASTPITFSVAAANYTILDNDGAGVTQSGDWSTSTYFPGYYGADYHYAPDAAGSWFQWTTALTAGNYTVYARWPASAERPSDAVYEITHSGGTASVPANQTIDGNQWNVLGTYTFGSTGTVRLLSSATGTEGAAADAIRFTLSAADTTPPTLSGLSPTGTLARDTTTATVTVATSETAECRHSTTPSFDWDSGTTYTATNSTTHSGTVPTTPGKVHRIYTACRDLTGNQSTPSVTTFIVPRKPMHKVW